VNKRNQLHTNTKDDQFKQSPQPTSQIRTEKNDAEEVTYSTIAAPEEALG